MTSTRLTLLRFLLALGVAACDHEGRDGAADEPASSFETSADPVPPQPSSAGAPAVGSPSQGEIAPGPGGGGFAVGADSPEPPPTETPQRMFAKKFVVPVRAGPSREADRIGYLRAGAVVDAKTAQPVGSERCRGGWYELTTGGYVCNGRTVIAFEGEQLPAIRAEQPDREAPLPYEYGFVRKRVPQYRRLPNPEEAAEFESGVAGADGEGADNADGVADSNEPQPQSQRSSINAAPSAMDTRSPLPDPDEAPSGPEEPPGGSAESDEEEDEGPTLASLQGEEDTILERWLMRGFYVSLDRDFRRNGRRYWRTQANGFVPYGAVMKRSGSEFAGVALSEEITLPYAWTLSSRAAVYTRQNNGRFRRARGSVEYHHGFPVLEEVEDGRNTYLRGPDDQWYRDRDVRVARLDEPASEIGLEDKWMDVNLERQTLVLYQGRTPVYATLVSSGLPDRPNLDRDFETLSGLFHVKSKHLTDTMDGDTAVDGPYSVDDVPYVIYFELAYALHSAFWHNRFGRPKSHGCVNLAPLDARHVFGWADPPLPDGWHSVYPTEESPGTWVYVHGDTVGRR